MKIVDIDKKVKHEKNTGGNKVCMMLLISGCQPLEFYGPLNV